MNDRSLLAKVWARYDDIWSITLGASITLAVAIIILTPYPVEMFGTWPDLAIAGPALVGVLIVTLGPVMLLCNDRGLL